MKERPGEDAGSGARKQREAQSLFSRPMPGGGSVRVEILVSDRGNVAGERVSGRVVIDADRERDAVVVEEMEGRDADEVVPELLRIARDNAAIARRVLKKQSDNTAS